MSQYTHMRYPGIILFILFSVFLLGMGCHTPPPVSPDTLAKERARQSVDRLNARVIHAYQERQEAMAHVQRLQTRLHQPGLSPKERANIVIDLEEGARRVMAATDHVVELEEGLRQEWDSYRARYGRPSQVAGPFRR